MLLSGLVARLIHVVELQKPLPIFTFGVREVLGAAGLRPFAEAAVGGAEALAGGAGPLFCEVCRIKVRSAVPLRTAVRVLRMQKTSSRIGRTNVVAEVSAARKAPAKLGA